MLLLIIQTSLEINDNLCAFRKLLEISPGSHDSLSIKRGSFCKGGGGLEILLRTCNQLYGRVSQLLPSLLASLVIIDFN